MRPSIVSIGTSFLSKWCLDPAGNIDGIVESFSASNLDDALDMLEVVNAKTDKASVGNMASGLEKHPEVGMFFQSSDSHSRTSYSIASVQSFIRGVLRTRAT